MLMLQISRAMLVCAICMTTGGLGWCAIERVAPGNFVVTNVVAWLLVLAAIAVSGWKLQKGRWTRSQAMIVSWLPVAVICGMYVVVVLKPLLQLCQ